MTKKTAGAVTPTQAYIDAGDDKTRQYAENLFQKARARIEDVEKSHGHCIDDRLAQALQKIRPVPTVTPPTDPIRIVVLKYPDGRVTVDVK